jgi:hypothetical protein
MGGYQLMISADIFLAAAPQKPGNLSPASDKPLLYRSIPTAIPPRLTRIIANPTSWFRYTPTRAFVPNIFWAEPADYRKAMQRIYHSSVDSSFIELPLVSTP